MKSRTTQRPDLKVIEGGLYRRLSIGPLQVVIGPEKYPPFPVDGVVAEEDTFFVLSADARLRDPEDKALRIMTRLIEAKPARPGTVWVTSGRPCRLLAVVHDLNEEPTWREEWISEAIRGVFMQAEARNIQSLALPMIGTRHGRLEQRRFVALLMTVLGKMTPAYPQRLWLVVPRGESGKTLAMMQDALDGRRE